VANACRAHMEMLAIDNPGADRGIVTLSIGVASVLPCPDITAEHLVERADKALYAAKAGGRNRVCKAETQQTEPHI
jgi:two-component system, chemotaxis family, response regulator WspR